MRILERFRRDRRGNFGMMMAVAAVPLVLGVGVAVDYSTMVRIRGEFQHALDAAALAVAREGKDVSDDDARKIAEEMLESNFGAGFANLQIKRKGTRFQVSAETKAGLAFGALFDADSWNIKSSATA